MQDQINNKENPLHPKKQPDNSEGILSELEKLRVSIDQIDHLLIQLLAKRRNIVIEIANIKIDNNIDLWDGMRVQNIKKLRSDWGLDHDLDPGFIEKLFGMLIDHNMDIERRILEERHKSQNGSEGSPSPKNKES